MTTQDRGTSNAARQAFVRKLILMASILPNASRDQIDHEHVQHLKEKRRRGIALPLIVVVPEGDKYRITSGMHRYLAEVELGSTEIEVIVREDATPEDEILDTWGENEDRVGFTIAEKARIILGLMALGNSQTETAEKLCISAAQVSKVLSVSKNLAVEAQALIGQGDFNPAIAYELSKHPDKTKQRELALSAVKGCLTREAAVKAVKIARKQRVYEKKKRLTTPGGLAVVFPSLDVLLAESLALAKAARMAMRLGIDPDNLGGVLAKLKKPPETPLTGAAISSA